MGAPDRLFSRFIPKEELGEAASWEFQPLHDTGTPLRGTERLLSEREKRACARGRAEGFEAGRQSVLAERAQHGRELALVLDALRGRFAELESVGAEQVLDLALAIARSVVCREVTVARDAVLPPLREAVAMIIDQQAHPRVHLNPQDLALVRADLDADGLLKDCRFIADQVVPRGGCLVQTHLCEVDARLENRWQRVMESLGLPEAGPLNIAQESAMPAPAADDPANGR
jgi:flagellar assembly protein FliH